MIFLLSRIRVCLIVLQTRETNKPQVQTMAESKLHIAMYPWFAFGHMNPFLLLSNELAKRGHKISFLSPNKAISQLQSSNLNHSLITFYPITVPHVDPLPLGTETASEIPMHQTTHLVAAMDLTRSQVREMLSQLKPDLVFYDFAHWVPELAKELGFKTVFYSVVSASAVAIALVPGLNVSKDRPMTKDELAEPPHGYPSKTIVFRRHEAAKSMGFLSREFGRGITFYERITSSMSCSDAIAMRTCQEVEGDLCDYIAAQYQKPMLLSGPVLPEPSQSPLEDKWGQWLGNFDTSSVIFCAFGSQWILEKDQFQELVLGLELTGLPFLVALKPPTGALTLEEALPEGFKDRVGDRGIVYGGWVPQVEILSHKSVGCFVNHCGFGSMWESLMCESQIVLVPHLGDQILNTRFMADELKVALEVERDESAWFSKEDLCKAVKSVMDKESDMARSIRKNHAKWKEILVSQGFMSDYIDKFIQKLNEL